MKDKNKFYITTPIYYANGAPHLGGAYTTIAADVLARWNKQKGKEVFFLTGTDEHGQKIQEIAERSGKTPKEFVDEVVLKWKKAFKLLNINNDFFIRTTDPRHEEEVKKLLVELYKKGLIYKGNYESYYCVGCEQYLTKKDLVDGKCPLHNLEPELKKEEAYLFKLSKFQEKLKELIESGEYEILPESRRKEILSFLDNGLEDVSISRLKEKIHWGITLPFDKKHVAWVWPDAFWNYVSGLVLNGVYDKFWPADVQLMAKDIFRVHATIWPALLLGAGKKLPKTLFIHGYFTIGGKKMSKSLGNVLDPIELSKKYGADAVRYYMLRNIAFGDDGDVSEKSLVERYNNELANKLGNLVSRVSGLIEKNGTEKCENNLIKKLGVRRIEKHFENFEFDKVLNEIFAFVDVCNEYVQGKKPWETGDKKVLYELKESILEISRLLLPFIPESAEKINKQFNVKDIKKSEILFKKK
jgi:methionyl-tRNA synthetase